MGLDTLGEGMKAMAEAGDSTLMLINWVSVVGKVMLGLLALALARQWRSALFRRLLQIGAWVAGALLALMLSGAMDIARLLGSVSAARWHLFLWDPVWLLGGILFLLAAWRYSSVKRQ